MNLVLCMQIPAIIITPDFFTTVNRSILQQIRDVTHYTCKSDTRQFPNPPTQSPQYTKLHFLVPYFSVKRFSLSKFPTFATKFLIRTQNSCNITLYLSWPPHELCNRRRTGRWQDSYVFIDVSICIRNRYAMFFRDYLCWHENRKLIYVTLIYIVSKKD